MSNCEKGRLVTESKSSNMINLTLSPNMESQGTFNENLRRSFGKNLLPSRPCSADSKRRNMRRKISQVMIIIVKGRLPNRKLVKTWDIVLTGGREVQRIVQMSQALF